MVIYELSTGRYPWADRGMSPCGCRRSQDIASFPALFDHLCSQPEPRPVRMASHQAVRLDPEYFPAELIEFDAYCLTRDVSRRPEAWYLRGAKGIAQDTEFLLARASD